MKLFLLTKESQKWSEELYSLLTEVYQISPWSQAQIVSDLAKPYIFYVVAVENEVLLGFIAFQVSKFEVELLQIAIKPCVQRKGIASQLMGHLPQGKEVFLEVRQSNQVAQQFYKHQHFSVIGVRKSYYHQPVEDAIVMRRQNAPVSISD